MYLQLQSWFQNYHKPISYSKLDKLCVFCCLSCFLCSSPRLIPFTSPPLSSPEADDLAQYLDHLLAHAAPKKLKSQVRGGLSRFRAAASKTKVMVSLKNKAQELNIQSELMHHVSDLLEKWTLAKFRLRSVLLPHLV